MQITNLQISGGLQLWPSDPVYADPYFEYTTLLLPGNGTNNGNNNTFLDSSSNNYTFTRFGNPTQGTFSPFSPTGWSNYFDGTGDYLSFPSNAAFAFGTGDITIECWFYQTSRSTTQTLFSNGNDTLNLYINTSGVFGIYDGSVRNSSQTVPLNSWNHFAYVRSSGTAKAYFNGTEVLSFSSSTNYSTTSARIGLNNGVGASDYTAGYISNLRVVKGTAVYTSAFTPPTASLTAITNTSLLTCQSNRFIDNSTNNLTVTRNGDTSVQSFSPFNPAGPYSSATYGGSGYFDGTGDYLSTSPITIGTNAYTFETWAYFNSVSGQNGVINAFNNSDGSKFALRLTRFTGADYLVLLESYPTGSTGWVFPQWVAKQWYHYVVVRNASNQTTCWVNGVRSTSGILTNAVASANYAPIDGVQVASGPGNSIDGYLSGTRLVIGSALYDVNSPTISVPTSPPTNIANTSLLLNYTNGQISDATSKNNLETIGDAKISTAQSKFGGSSMYFDGTGDWLTIPNSQNFVFGSGDWTVELWVRPASTSRQGFVTLENSAGTNVPWEVGINASGKFRVLVQTSAGQVVIDGSTTPTINTWYHIAAVRNGSTVTLYVNGVSEATGNVSTNALVSETAPVYVGTYNYGFPLNGYIDDLRITKGIARYTTNFTPPTTAFTTF